MSEPRSDRDRVIRFAILHGWTRDERNRHLHLARGSQRIAVEFGQDEQIVWTARYFYDTMRGVPLTYHDSDKRATVLTWIAAR